MVAVAQRTEAAVAEAMAEEAENSKTNINIKEITIWDLSKQLLAL